MLIVEIKLGKMMRKLITLLSVCIAGLALAACGNSTDSQSKTNSSLKAENSSLKAEEASSIRTTPIEDRYNNAEYAMAAYLKLQNTDASSLQNTENMTWQQQGNRYIIGFGGHTTSMAVNRSNVEVTYDDVEDGHMGSGNGHKTYSKTELAKLISSQKEDIDNLLNNSPTSFATDQRTNNSETAENESNTTNTNSGANHENEHHSSPRMNYSSTIVGKSNSSTMTNFNAPNSTTNTSGGNTSGGNTPAPPAR